MRLKSALRRGVAAAVIAGIVVSSGIPAYAIRWDIAEGNITVEAGIAKGTNKVTQGETTKEDTDTVITGDGGSLSQGERQLLAIARAAVSDPPVLILDEATSSIDTRTEKLIEQGMDSLMAGRTVFVIAHRLSTIRKADMILVVRDGRIVEQGTHQELLRRHGYYHDLYSKQFAEESAARILQ